MKPLNEHEIKMNLIKIITYIDIPEGLIDKINEHLENCDNKEVEKCNNCNAKLTEYVEKLKSIIE